MLFSVELFSSLYEEGLQAYNNMHVVTTTANIPVLITLKVYGLKDHD